MNHVNIQQYHGFGPTACRLQSTDRLCVFFGIGLLISKRWQTWIYFSTVVIYDSTTAIDISITLVDTSITVIDVSTGKYITC